MTNNRPGRSPFLVWSVGPYQSFASCKTRRLPTCSNPLPPTPRAQARVSNSKTALCSSNDNPRQGLNRCTMLLLLSKAVPPLLLLLLQLLCLQQYWVGETRGQG